MDTKKTVSKNEPGDNFTLSLAAARVNTGLSRKEVSAKTGITISMLGRYETGKSEPRASDLQKLCALYHVRIDQLRFDDIEPITAGRGRPPKKKKKD